MDKALLMTELEGLKSTLEVSINEKTKGEIAEQLKAAVAELDAKISSLTNNDSVEAVKAITEEFNTLKADQVSLLKGFDLLQTRVKTSKKETMENNSFGEVFAAGLKENAAALETLKKGQSVKIDMKEVKDMSLIGNLTGDGTASYSARQAVLPAQKINFRDLVPTTVSPTGLYVQYRETGATGTIGVQTEGDPKSQVDYDFTEIKVVENYIAGFSRFTKQMAKQLPYMQGTLPRIMTRDFYKAENSSFFTTVSTAATGVNTTTGANIVEIIMDLIANQNAANFSASFAIVHPVTLAAINKVLLTNGYYPGAAGISSVANGSLAISGTPVIAASWAVAGNVLIIDADYCERVETEGLNVQFAMEDGDNFTKNQITARIECQEEINLMLPVSAIYYID